VSCYVHSRALSLTHVEAAFLVTSKFNYGYAYNRGLCYENRLFYTAVQRSTAVVAHLLDFAPIWPTVVGLGLLTISTVILHNMLSYFLTTKNSNM